MVAISSVEPSSKAKYTAFRGTYVVLPAAFLLASVVLAAFFYGRLPAEVAYHFTGGAPDSWLGRGAIIAWMLAPQCFLFLCAIIITSVGGRLGRRLSLEESALTRKALMVMGTKYPALRSVLTMRTIMMIIL